MKVIEQKIEPYIERLICDFGTEMQHEPYGLTSYPMQYVYKCPKCGKVFNSPKDYPYPFYKYNTKIPENDIKND